MVSFYFIFIRVADVFNSKVLIDASFSINYFLKNSQHIDSEWYKPYTRTLILIFSKLSVFFFFSLQDRVFLWSLSWHYLL